MLNFMLQIGLIGTCLPLRPKIMSFGQLMRGVRPILKCVACILLVLAFAFELVAHALRGCASFLGWPTGDDDGHWKYDDHWQ